MSSSWGAALAAVLALVGTAYAARQARMAGREAASTTASVDQRQLDQSAFQAIQDSLQRQIDRMREEVGQLKAAQEKLAEDVADRERKIRVAMGYVRQQNQVLTSNGLSPVVIPPELIPWSI